MTRPSIKDKDANKDLNKKFDDVLTDREKELDEIGKWGIDYEKRNGAFQARTLEKVHKAGTRGGNGETRKISREILENWSTKELLARYENLKRITLKNMPNLWFGLEFAISVKTILNMKGNTLPFSGILLGPASSSKTVIIELFRGYKHTFYTDNFSPKSLVSHNSSVKKEKLKEIDMLPKLKNKFFLTPELAPIFATRDDDLLQILSILTRVSDGKGYESDSGALGHRGYDENIMYSWLGAAVDIPYKVHKLLGTLGPKLYFFRLPRIEETEDFYYNTRAEIFEEKNEEIRTALHEYLYYFEMNPEITFEGDSSEDNEGGIFKLPVDIKNDDELADRIIIRLSKLLAHLRGIVPTWETRDTQGSEYAYTMAKIEDPSRAITQLRNLARGHALSQGRKSFTLDDIPIVIHTALSTATTERVRIFEILIENKGSLTTSQICSFLNTTNPTARRTMAELKAVGLVEMDERLADDGYNQVYEITLKSEFNWFLSKQFMELRGGLKEKLPPGTHHTNNEASESEIESKISIDHNQRACGGENSFNPTQEVTLQVSKPKLSFSYGKWHCEGCNQKGDRFDMEDHKCNGKKGF